MGLEQTITLEIKDLIAKSSRFKSLIAKGHNFFEPRSRKTVRISQQVKTADLSADKYPSIFPRLVNAQGKYRHLYLGQFVFFTGHIIFCRELFLYPSKNYYFSFDYFANQPAEDTNRENRRLASLAARSFVETQFLTFWDGPRVLALV